MPLQKGQSSLMAKLGNRLAGAHQKAAAEETKFDSGGDLPPGIMGGIAQLAEIKFDVYKEGDFKDNYFFYAAGIVCSPTEHDGIRIEGLRTSLMEPICDSPTRSRKTVEEHIAWVYNELRKLGVDTKVIDIAGKSGPSLETVCTALKQTKPYFRFRTWIGEATEKYPDPRVNHVWNGLCDYKPTASVNGELVDQSGQVDELPPTAAPQAPSANGHKAPTVQTPIPQANDDLDALVATAKGDGPESEKAAERLISLAMAAGIDQTKATEAPTWEAVQNMITEARAGSGGNGAVSDWTPNKGDVYYYKPLGKNKKKVEKPIEVEVQTVYPDNKTFDLLNLEDKKTLYKGISWDALEKE